jgi:prephenate dehydratase
MTKIGLQGAIGSFSEMASKEFAEKHKVEGYELDYLISSEGVLQAISNKTIDYGVIAIENAQGGVVIESIHALAHHNCDIVSLFHVDISQNLLVKPGTRSTDIKEIHSHQQALRQCRNYLADHFWSCPLIEEDDTAEAARRLSEGELTHTTAVIANAACAKLYGLEIIAPDIHDLKHNLTLFAAIEQLKE